MAPSANGSDRPTAARVQSEGEQRFHSQVMRAAQLRHPCGMHMEDGSSEGESRWITVGMNAGGEVLVVVWTARDGGER